MPELPEVETIRRQLAPLVEGRRLEQIEILDPRWSRPLAPAELADALRGRRVQSWAGAASTWCGASTSDVLPGPAPAHDGRGAARARP